MARMPYVRQRGRWWPLSALGRRTTSTPPASDREQRSEAIPTTTDRFPTVIGRTQTMFSPVKAITAGALVFAIGGLFLIAQPFDQQGSVPGAEQGADPMMAPAVVTGTMSFGPEESVYYEASDPRLDGEMTWVASNDLEYETPGISIEATIRELVNDDGRWVGTDTGLGVTDSITVDGIEYDTRFRGSYLNIDFIVMQGEDAYEGLTAVIVEDWEAPFGSPATFVGAIVPDMPAFPELPAE
jgi:hypothetical protein